MNDQKLIFAALAFAALKHRDQRRKGIEASPYINHPIDLANVLVNEADVADPIVIAAAILHDTVEDTDTTFSELKHHFGEVVMRVVAEVTDDQSLRKAERKRLQIEHAATASHEARLVKLADKICNLRDMQVSPPTNWDIDRQREYFEWAKAVIDQLRGTHTHLEDLFDQVYALKP